MAYAITGPSYGQLLTDFDGRKTAADQATTTSALDTARGRNWLQVRIWQKTFTAGTGTARPLYDIQAADDSAFTSNLRRIGTIELPRASNSNGFLLCFCPDGAKRYFRIVPTLDGTDAVNYDVEVVGS